MFFFGFIRGAVLGVSLGLISGLIIKKSVRKKIGITLIIRNLNPIKKLSFLLKSY